jgi:hypothetical protein
MTLKQATNIKNKSEFVSMTSAMHRKHHSKKQHRDLVDCEDNTRIGNQTGRYGPTYDELMQYYNSHFPAATTTSQTILITGATR